MQNPVFTLLSSRSTGPEKGIWSCCSANAYVIRSAMRRAKAKGTVVLVEATANQVNQNGGYTGMTPVDFMAFVRGLALEEGFPMERLICGGDHLGPLTWTQLPEQEAMAHAVQLVREYVLAGFQKIHIDTSMRVLDDDPAVRLSDEVIARRGAVLCQAAEEAFEEYQMAHPDAVPPVYVIGSEVPIPGGAQEKEDAVIVTNPGDCEAALEAFRREFLVQGLEKAWTRVIAMVVQPGVEFGDETVLEYDREKARELMSWLSLHPGLVFEGHSTDYQPKEKLKEMAADGIAILKVGPALTFNLREGLFALEKIEQELYSVHDFPPSHFRDVLEQVMLEESGQWKKYYHGDVTQRRYARAFSYSDRARYYLTHPRVQTAICALIRNLNNISIPLALLSQYMPVQYARVQSGQIKLKAEDLLVDHIGDRMDDYLYAVL